MESDLSINPPGFSIQLCNGDRGASQRVNKILKRRYGITGELISGNSTPGVVALWPKRTHPEEEEEEDEEERTSKTKEKNKKKQQENKKNKKQNNKQQSQFETLSK